jgi:hypothetical protein
VPLSDLCTTFLNNLLCSHSNVENLKSENLQLSILEEEKNNLSRIGWHRSPSEEAPRYTRKKTDIKKKNETLPKEKLSWKGMVLSSLPLC